jgi:hypothetical protein
MQHALLRLHLAVFIAQLPDFGRKWCLREVFNPNFTACFCFLLDR